ncbi:MAG: pilus assembly protein PilP [Magnetococcales bacterium]|nr:pilus assembly protein PilP [Magnetococcales bacterium]
MVILCALVATLGVAEAKTPKKSAQKSDTPIKRVVHVKRVVDPFVYRAEGKRDPFVSPFDIISGPTDRESSDAMPTHPPEPLEAFQLDALKLVATMRMGGESVAMVSDPSGKGHTVRVGNYMGTRGGRVEEIHVGNHQGSCCNKPIKISAGGLVLIENMPTPRNPRATRVTVLKLFDEEAK